MMQIQAVDYTSYSKHYPPIASLASVMSKLFLRKKNYWKKCILWSVYKHATDISTTLENTNKTLTQLRCKFNSF